MKADLLVGIPYLLLRGCGLCFKSTPEPVLSCSIPSPSIETCSDVELDSTQNWRCRALDRRSPPRICSTSWCTAVCAIWEQVDSLVDELTLASEQYTTAFRTGGLTKSNEREQGRYAAKNRYCISISSCFFGVCSRSSLRSLLPE
jgi:hypothetical protein